MVADLGSEIDAEIVVGGCDPVGFEVDALRRWRVVDLVAQRPGLDVHRLVDPGHLVDDVAVGAGDVDDDLGSRGPAVGERDPGDTTISSINGDDLGAEPELGTVRFGSALEVVAGELGIAHIPCVGGEIATLDCPLRVLPERIIVGTCRGPEQTRVEIREPFLDRGGIPRLVRDVHLVPQGLDPSGVGALTGRLEDELAGHVVVDQPELVVGADVRRPVLPVVHALPREVGPLHA